MNYNPKIKIMFENKDGKFFGPGLFDLLNLINQNNSIKESAFQMGISYSKARKMIKNLELELGEDVIVTKSGGVGGGESYITEYAEEFITLYDQYLTEVINFSEMKFLEIYKEK